MRARPAGDGAGGKVGRKRVRNRPTSSVVELVVIVAVALGLALGIQAFCQALPDPERLDGTDAECRSAGAGQPHRQWTSADPHVGEIAVFHPPEGAEQQVCGPVPHMVTPGGAACVAAEPQGGERELHQAHRRRAGRRMYIREGHVFRKARGRAVRAEKDSYIRPVRRSDVPDCNFPTAIKIPAGHWFMMGDNRGESDDSRFWGPVPTGWIIGGAFATYWPPDRIGFL